MTSGRPPEMGVAFFYLYVTLLIWEDFMSKKPTTFWGLVFWGIIAAVSIGFVRGFNSDDF